MIRQHSHLPLHLLAMLAWRNIWRHRRRTLITLSSIAIGFALAVLMIGLNDGAHNSMIRNAIKLGEGHLTIQPKGYLEAPANHKYLADGATLQQQIAPLKIPGRVEPRISLQVLANSASNSVGARLEGLHPLADQRADLLRPKLVSGSWIQPGDQRGILIGQGMAGKLKVRVGGKVVLMAGKQGGDSQAELGRVRGIFDAGLDELDDYLILSDMQLARHFLAGEGADPTRLPVTRFALFLDDPDQISTWQARLQAAITDNRVAVLDWRDMMPQLVQFIMVDDAGNAIFLLLILIMMVFGILNTVLMSVLERTRELGLLRALGLSRYHLLWLVFCESLLLSLLAVSIGWLVAGSVHGWFAYHGIDIAALMGGSTELMGTFMDPVIHTELSGARVLQLTLLIFAATLGSGIYPAIKASRITPVEALRT